MAPLIQSSTVSSAIRHQLYSATKLPLFPSLRLDRAFSAICASARRVQFRNEFQWLHQVSSPKSFPPSQQSRTFLAKLTRKSPATTHATRTSASVVAVPSAQARIPPLQLTNLPYFVRRTPSNQLPVYLVTKAGGTKQQTKIQKTEGDLDALRSDLARVLGLESGDPHAKKSPDVTINRLTRHIIVKGWRKPEILNFLKERNF